MSGEAENDEEYIRQWLSKAERDLKVAEHEMDLAEDEMLTDAICFHSQQAVEKFLKAYLISRKIDFSKTHNLEFLVELCSEEDEEFKGLNVGNLSHYAVGVRYPDDPHIPDIGEAKECFDLAKNIKKFILKKIWD